MSHRFDSATADKDWETILNKQLCVYLLKKIYFYYIIIIINNWKIYFFLWKSETTFKLVITSHWLYCQQKALVSKGVKTNGMCTEIFRKDAFFFEMSI